MPSQQIRERANGVRTDDDGIILELRVRGLHGGDRSGACHRFSVAVVVVVVVGGLSGGGYMLVAASEGEGRETVREGSHDVGGGRSVCVRRGRRARRGESEFRAESWIDELSDPAST